MKIVVLGTAWPYRGGIALFNERLAREFQKENDEVITYTFTLQYPSFLFPGKTQYSEEPAPQGMNIVRKVNSVNPFNWIKVGRELKKMAPDLIVIGFWLPFMAPCLGTIARIARKNGKTRVVSVVHNIVPHEHRIGDKMFATYFCNSVDGFVAMSDSVLNDLTLFDSVKPRVFCRHPLYDNFGEAVERNSALQELGLDSNNRYMLFFGLIRDYKGLDIMLKAYADSRLRQMGVKLIVAGEFYNNADKYHALEKELGLEGKIHWFSDYIPNEEVTRFFSVADLVVQPYKTATQSGISQMAYHFEKPMVVTAVGGLPEIVPNGKVGYVVPVDDKAVADAVVDFFDHHTAADFAAYIKEEKKKYTWENFCNVVRQYFL
jgi:glycosyltransferase involved in cell wall biosynthesis